MLHFRPARLYCYEASAFIGNYEYVRQNVFETRTRVLFAQPSSANEHEEHFFLLCNRHHQYN